MFMIMETDWVDSGQYTINVMLFQGTTNMIHISLTAGVFSIVLLAWRMQTDFWWNTALLSTLGNIMNGGCILFPDFSCSGTTCTITTPPNAYVSPPGWHQLFVLDGPTPSHSGWVRIGGDPAALGNRPDFPDFMLPGVWTRQDGT